MPDPTDNELELARALNAQTDEFLLLNDRAMRMEVALRIIRIYAMGEIMLQDSGAVRDWLRDWIDGNFHGPVGGPLLWPTALPTVARQLLIWGFGKSPEGFVILVREPAMGEKVN